MYPSSPCALAAEWGQGQPGSLENSASLTNRKKKKRDYNGIVGGLCGIGKALGSTPVQHEKKKKPSVMKQCLYCIESNKVSNYCEYYQINYILKCI